MNRGVQEREPMCKCHLMVPVTPGQRWAGREGDAGPARLAMRLKGMPDPTVL